MASIVEVARAYYEAAERRNVAALLEILHFNVEFRLTEGLPGGLGGVHEGREAASAVSHQEGWTYRLERREEDGTWLLRSADPDGWSDLYSFTLEPQRLVDHIVYNHFTSTHPASPFVGRAVAIRTAPGVRHTLRGRELVSARPDGSNERRELTDEEIPKVLGQTFGVVLIPGEIARLRSGA